MMDPLEPLVRIAIFASGTGSNAQKIIDHFRDNPFIRVALVVTNKPDAGVLAIAQRENIPSLILQKAIFFTADSYMPELASRGIDFITLAGFLWKIPATLIKNYPGKIINIHPALLPAYGGKGMYGARVHEAVIAAGEKDSGITIHYVDELYDHGQIIFQARCRIDEKETPETLARKVHLLEHEWFPKVIEEIIVSKKIVKR